MKPHFHTALHCPAYTLKICNRHSFKLSRKRNNTVRGKASASIIFACRNVAYIRVFSDYIAYGKRSRFAVLPYAHNPCASAEHASARPRKPFEIRPVVRIGRFTCQHLVFVRVYVAKRLCASFFCGNSESSIRTAFASAQSFPEQKYIFSPKKRQTPKAPVNRRSLTGKL